MKIKEHILTENPCFKAGRKIQPTGIMLHSVGVNQPNATVFLNTWNRSTAKVCVHAFIDGNNGTVYQTLPWDHRAWHCGSAANNTHISVEMCEPAYIRYIGGSSFSVLPGKMEECQLCAKRTYEAAVELFAHLCKEYNLDPLKSRAIISHAEGHKLGIASNHGDPEHLWKGLKMGYTMDGFRKDVAAAITGKAPTVSVSTGFIPFTVRVKVSDLNIRKGPGTNFPINNGKVTGKGVFTIVDEDNGWGLLKSYAKSRDGWISLNQKYVERI